MDRVAWDPLLSDPWDVGAWVPVVEAALATRVDDEGGVAATQALDRCLKLFPTHAALVLACCHRQLAAGRVDGVEHLLQRALLSCPHVPLHQFYVDFVIATKLAPVEAAWRDLVASGGGGSSDGGVTRPRGSTTHYDARRVDAGGESGEGEVATAQAREAVAAARAAVEEAFEFAVDQVGWSPRSGQLWRAYAAFLSPPTDGAATATPHEVSVRRLALRKVYQRAVTVAHDAVEPLWAEYTAWENATSQTALAAAQIKEWTANAATAAAAVTTRQRLWAGVGVDAASWKPEAGGWPWMPGAQGVPVATLANTAVAWRRVLAYEATNPCRLPPADHAAMMQYAHRACTSVMRNFPDFHLDHVRWQVEAVAMAAKAADGALTAPVDPAAVASAAFEAARAATPLSALLACAHSEHEEQGKRNDLALAAMKSLLSTVEAVAEAGPAVSGRTLATWGAVFDSAAVVEAGCVTPAHLPTLADVQAAAAAVPLVHIWHMRCAQRVAGVQAARDAFAAGRKSRHVTPAVYLAAAQLEHTCNRALQPARRILELGRKHFPRDVAFLLSALDFLTAVDDGNNVRAFFESALTDLPPADSRPVWDRYIAFEWHTGAPGCLAAVTSLEGRRAAAHPHLVGPHVRLLARVIPRNLILDTLPHSRYDLDFAQRHPYGPFAVVPASSGGTAPPTTLTPAAWLVSHAPGAVPAGVEVRDGIYPQAPPGHSNTLSHIPTSALLPDVAQARTGLVTAAAAGVLGSGTGHDEEVGRPPAVPPPSFLLPLLARLPAYDAPATQRLASNVEALMSRWAVGGATLAGVKRGRDAMSS